MAFQHVFSYLYLSPFCFDGWYTLIKTGIGKQNVLHIDKFIKPCASNKTFPRKMGMDYFEGNVRRNKAIICGSWGYFTICLSKDVIRDWISFFRFENWVMLGWSEKTFFDTCFGEWMKFFFVRVNVIRSSLAFSNDSVPRLNHSMPNWKTHSLQLSDI